MAMTLPLPPQNMPAEVYSYLFQMVQLLNLSADAISTGAAILASNGASPTAGGGKEAATDDEQYNELKSLIIKTANTVHHEMDQLTTKLSEEYIATSEFGTYTQELNAYIEANPEALTQYYSFASALQANVDAVDAAFKEYKVDTEGYIRTGIVYYDGDTPIYGVAVGQNLTATEVDGQQVVDQNNFRAVFTANRLSFWQDSVEVAYMSNNKLYITNSTVLENLQIGEWSVSSTNGLAFKWIGG